MSKKDTPSFRIIYARIPEEYRDWPTQQFCSAVSIAVDKVSLSKSPYLDMKSDLQDSKLFRVRIKLLQRTEERFAWLKNQLNCSIQDAVTFAIYTHRKRFPGDWAPYLSN